MPAKKKKAAEEPVPAVVEEQAAHPENEGETPVASGGPLADGVPTGGTDPDNVTDGSAGAADDPPAVLGERGPGDISPEAAPEGESPDGQDGPAVEQHDQETPASTEAAPEGIEQDEDAPGGQHIEEEQSAEEGRSGEEPEPAGGAYIAFVPEAEADGDGGESGIGEDLRTEEQTAEESGEQQPDETASEQDGESAVESIGKMDDTSAEDKPKRKKAASKKSPAPPPKPDFYASDFRELDRDLSPRQRKEWEGIYASFRSKNLLYGKVIGSDPKTFDLKEEGGWVRKKMFCPVVVDYRVKVLIPSTEMWMPGEERPEFVLQEMKGANIAYAIISVDREGECAIGSRRIAMAAQRHYFSTVRGGHHEGELLKCNVLTVGPKLCLVECGGYDITLSQRELSYTAIPDLREKYHPGDELDCRLKEYVPKENKLVISVKEVEPNPFIGADTRHPVGSRRNATISGKYKGGVFCTLDDGTVVLCLYSPMHSDLDFQNGDGVVIAISKFDYQGQLVYGRILSKW